MYFKLKAYHVTCYIALSPEHVLKGSSADGHLDAWHERDPYVVGELRRGPLRIVVMRHQENKGDANALDFTGL